MRSSYPEGDYPHVRAAFINAISEEGTKAEAIAYLQKQWNECCALRAEIRRLTGVAQGSGDCGAKAYVERAIASYIGDPADNQFQKGFLAALEVVRDEAFRPVSTNQLCPDCGRSLDGPTHAAYCAVTSTHHSSEAT